MPKQQPINRDYLKKPFNISHYTMLLLHPPDIRSHPYQAISACIHYPFKVYLFRYLSLSQIFVSYKILTLLLEKILVS